MEKIKYLINELFVTIQGEATFSGTPSIFIRLQGCQVGCPWCDTKNTWVADGANKTNFTSIIDKKQDDNKWCEATPMEITDYIQKNFTHVTHVVITGGEPALYNLVPLCEALQLLNKSVQIETSGTEEIKVTQSTWVTISPKINMPGGKIVLQSAVARANEIKMPIGKMADIEKLKQFLHDYNVINKPIWLQPLSLNKTATEICIEQAILNNWKLSIQTHKYIYIK